MRILFLINSYPPLIGGAEKLVESLSREFTARGHPCIIITRRIKGTPLIQKNNLLRIYRIPCFGPRLLKSLLFRLVASFLLVILRRDYHLIHAHSLDSPAAIASVMGPPLGKPVFVTIHNTGKVKALINRPGGRRSLSRIIRASTAMISINRDISVELAEAGCPAKKLAFIRNGVNTGLFRPLEDEQRLRKIRRMGFPDRNIFLFVGNFHDQKGIDTLLEAWNIFTAERSSDNCILLLIGDGVLSKSMQRMARDLNLESSVRFLGQRDDVHSFLQIANVFVQPSRWEGLSIALLEALASETAIIATPVGGTREIIRDGFNGLLCPVDQPEELSSRIDMLNRDANLCRKLAGEGRKTVEKNYSIGKCADDYLELFDGGKKKGEDRNVVTEDKEIDSSPLQCDQSSSGKETEKIPG